MAAAPGIADEVRALYHGPLAEFTAARQALAKRLRKAGDAARAAEVAVLRKPSLSAWAVGQLFAHEARAMAAFAGAGDRARASQSRAASGDSAALRAALATIRDESPRLLARAVELVAAAERAPGDAIVERIRTNLEALALDPATAPIAQRGWLDEDLAPPGFEVMASLQLAAAGTRPAPPPRGAAATPARSSRRAAAASAPPPPPPRPLATVTRIADVRSAAVERRAAAERDAGEARERRERERLERERGERLTRLRAEAADAERVAGERRAEAEQTAAEAERAVKEAEAAQRRAGEAQSRAREARQLAIAADAVARRARAALERAERG